MTFAIRLDVPATLSKEGHVDVVYDAELDDVRSILRDLCVSLAQLPDVRFAVSIGEPMPVSVRRDLVIVMEQLRDVVVSLRESGSATLDLYEQGVEAQVVFTAKDAHMTVILRDLLGRPKPLREMDLPLDVVMGSLQLLARTFVDAVRRRSPERCAHPWFEAWAESLLAAVSR